MPNTEATHDMIASAEIRLESRIEVVNKKLENLITDYRRGEKYSREIMDYVSKLESGMSAIRFEMGPREIVPDSNGGMMLRDKVPEVAKGDTRTRTTLGYPVNIHGIQYIGRALYDTFPNQLSVLVDDIKKELVSGVVALVIIHNWSVTIQAGVTDDLTEKVSALDLVRVGGKIAKAQIHGHAGMAWADGGYDLSGAGGIMEAIDNELASQILFQEGEARYRKEHREEYEASS